MGRSGMGRSGMGNIDNLGCAHSSKTIVALLFTWHTFARMLQSAIIHRKCL